MNAEEWLNTEGLAELEMILARCWDPVGVFGDLDFSGEYREYTQPVAELLIGGASTDEIRAYLRNVAASEMEVPNPDVRLDDAVRAIESYAESVRARLG
jgi:hypothetical protein